MNKTANNARTKQQTTNGTHQTINEQQTTDHKQHTTNQQHGKTPNRPNDKPIKQDNLKTTNDEQ